jgi:hypothetical protein
MEYLEHRVAVYNTKRDQFRSFCQFLPGTIIIIIQVYCVGNNILSLKKQEVGTDGQGFHKWQAMVKGTGNGDLWLGAYK